MTPYGQARRQHSNVLMLATAMIMGGLIVILATLLLQRHVRPDAPRLALVCWNMAWVQMYPSQLPPDAPRLALVCWNSPQEDHGRWLAPGGDEARAKHDL